MSQTRQLAAIMFTDIVGYTALMGENESKAYELLRKNRNLQKPIIERFNGKWIKEIGDGVLASFNTGTDAVLCAVAIQNACSGIPDLKLRIGIHLGDILFENEDVFGDGVNIASRIQAIAEPGGIYISESVNNNVSNKQEINTRFVRQETLKHVKEPVKIYEVILHGKVSAIENKCTINTAAENSIAVLPFTNMSSDPEQDYFSDGISEEILNSLAHIKELKVAGRTSSFQFKGKNLDLREVGKKLGVNNVLEGSVRKSMNKLRITAQLIKAEDGFHLWSERYDREIDDIFAIQDEIALAITEKLKLTLLENDKEQIVKTHTQNTAAHSFYLKGRFEWNKRTKEGFLKSIDYFNQAIREDPRYSLAHAGLADSFTLLCAYHFLSPENSITRARMAAEKSMELDPRLAEGYEAMGHIEFLINTNWQKAEDHYRKAIELNPSFSTAHQRFAFIQATEGRYTGALEEIKKATELDPLSKIINTDTGLIHLLMGNADKAIHKCNEVFEMDPDFLLALFVQGLAYEQTGKIEFAIANFQRAAKASNDNPIFRSSLGHALAISGAKTEALSVLHELETLSDRQFVSPYCLAVIYAGLGETNQVFEYLNKAVDVKSFWVIHLHISADPRFKKFNIDDRYKEFLRRIQIVKE